MRALLILFTLLFCCFACHRGKVKQGSQAGLLVGKWGIFETIQFQNNDDSISTSCNVCPQIIFANDESGSIKEGDLSQAFTWQLDSTSLVIKHKGDSAAFIGDGSYQLQQSKNNQFAEIILTDTVKDIKYVLRK